MVDFGKLLGKAKEMVGDKDKLSAVVDQATDMLDKKTGGKFHSELRKLDKMVDDMKPSDLDQLNRMVDKLDDLDDDDIAKLKDVVGKANKSKGGDLSEADMDRLKSIAGKLGLTEPH